MRHRVTVLTGVVLTGLTGAVVNPVWGSPAVADEPGFSVAVDAPDEFAVGGNAKTITAVVTSQNRQCRKVRWALLVHTSIDRKQFEVTRVEQEREFAVGTRTEGITTRFLDEAVDPGVLCRGRTVTGNWQIEFDGPDADEVQFEVQAFDVRDRLLTAGGAAAEVTGGKEPSESAAPSAPSAPEAGDSEEDAAPPAAAGNGGTAGRDGTEKALASEDSALLGPGLIVGGVFVFLGVGLLLRIRARASKARRQAEALPTGFYSMPGARR
ncbi:hypothetical protein [Actinoplanes sp. GCM10030250]|uniref:hypothetical protein n=1 Tax=Actinoplanes sp. GCM10030250 TaxID=3273376 RepID=UPI00361560D1